MTKHHDVRRAPVADQSIANYSTLFRRGSHAVSGDASISPRVSASTDRQGAGQGSAVAVPDPPGSPIVTFGLSTINGPVLHSADRVSCPNLYSWKIQTTRQRQQCLRFSKLKAGGKKDAVGRPWPSLPLCADNLCHHRWQSFSSPQAGHFILEHRLPWLTGKKSSIYPLRIGTLYHSLEGATPRHFGYCRL